MSSDHKWTIAIRPAAGEKPRKITKIIGLNGDGFSVLAPYHKARSGFLSKPLIDLRTFGTLQKWEQQIGFTAADRVKLSYHTDGFAQFSSEHPGKIISGRDSKTGEPKGLGLLARSLLSPSMTGPSVGVVVWGIEDFDTAREEEDLVIFEPSDFYYRGSTPQDANTWHLAIYAFGVGQLPPVRFEGKQAVMQYQLHAITAGVPGSIVQLKTIHLKKERVYLGMYVSRIVGNWQGVKSGWHLAGPGNYNQYQSGYVLRAVYPAGPIPVEGREALDRVPSAPVDAGQAGTQGAKSTSGSPQETGTVTKRRVPVQQSKRRESTKKGG